MKFTLLGKIERDHRTYIYIHAVKTQGGGDMQQCISNIHECKIAEEKKKELSEFQSLVRQSDT